MSSVTIPVVYTHIYTHWLAFVWFSTHTHTHIHTRTHTQRYVFLVLFNTRAHTHTHTHTHIHMCTCRFAPGGYEIASLAAGGAIVATEAVLRGELRNAYALVRPPGEWATVVTTVRTRNRGTWYTRMLVRCSRRAACRTGHHAERDHGMGFCIFNNVAVAAAHALAAHGLKRVAIVDFDVHHGNGTQVCVCVWGGAAGGAGAAALQRHAFAMTRCDVRRGGWTGWADVR